MYVQTQTFHFTYQCIVVSYNDLSFAYGTRISTNVFLVFCFTDSLRYNLHAIIFTLNFKCTVQEVLVNFKICAIIAMI